jgi:hypothetical protein
MEANFGAGVVLTRASPDALLESAGDGTGNVLTSAVQPAVASSSAPTTYFNL